MARLLSLVLLLLLALAAPAQAVGKRDRVPAKWTKAHTLTEAKARKDLDRDGLSTWAEWRSRTNPRKADSDGDGRPDGLEDRDRDGLTNAFEVSAKTDPARPDTDRDRRRDGREDADRDGLDHAAEAKYGFAPRKRDSDRDGVRDGDENAGVIRAVAGPLVTIALARGGTLVATLADETDVACRPPVGTVPADLLVDEDAEAFEEAIADEEDLLDEGDLDGAPGEELVDDLDEPLAQDSQLAEDDELVEPEVEEADCGTDLRAGDLVHSARTIPGPASLVFAALELLG